MSNEQTLATMKEAKTRFREFTRYVLSGSAREEIRKKHIWTMEDGIPTLRAGALILKFYRDDNSVRCLIIEKKKGEKKRDGKNRV